MSLFSITPRKAPWLTLVAAFVATSGAVATVASAQPGGSAAPPAKPGASQVGFDRLVDLTPQQEEAEAVAIISQMQATASTVQRMLGQARQARDVVKTLCLNDKVSQVDVGTRSAIDRKASLHAAASRNDRELSNHEFTIMTVLKHRVEQLSAEANQCIGEEASFSGATAVTTTVDNAMPTSDPTDTSTITLPPVTVAPVTTPPVSASSEQ